MPNDNDWSVLVVGIYVDSDQIMRLAHNLSIKVEQLEQPIYVGRLIDPICQKLCCDYVDGVNQPHGFENRFFLVHKDYDKSVRQLSSKEILDEMDNLLGLYKALQSYGLRTDKPSVYIVKSATHIARKEFNKHKVKVNT